MLSMHMLTVASLYGSVGNCSFTENPSPKIKWLLDDDGTYNEIYDAKIVAVSEDWVQFDGEDHNGNPVTVTIDVDDVIP